MSERTVQPTEAKLRSELLAARAGYVDVAREFDDFYTMVQARSNCSDAPDETPVIERLTVKQQVAFGNFQRALLAFTTFMFGSGNRRSFPESMPRHPRVTERQLQVLKSLAAGRTTKQIARELNISFKTALTHRSHLLQTFEANNVALLMCKAILQGYIQAND